MERRGAVCLSSIEGECEANIIEKYLTTYVGKSISFEWQKHWHNYQYPFIANRRKTLTSLNRLWTKLNYNYNRCFLSSMNLLVYHP